MRTVLDTGIVIAADVEPIPGELAISAATVAELHFGVLVARDEHTRAHRLKRLATLAKRFDPLPVDDAVAASYGELAAAVARSGRQPRARTMDLLIAATAHAHDARLVTRNPADFAAVDGLVDVATA
ncbi:MULTISPECIES: type II toxin-antitoxin system VapC family toxin [Prauserella salsuginis group]|uniref:Ribonuclease VapC n=1 Tax=Prauserella salsuginis TaxID=387889 RepID=A0ABW6G6E0_9PSEU|nr:MULTISPECIES: type II toxin-antitoxin system VapC family toxin [Prauserella salsuginis group]MCR3722808.1 hypothetical protein [Prauserella flava]MCR3737137.1 hypothetical protein [Prauserella salsuginis]